MTEKLMKHIMRIGTRERSYIAELAGGMAAVTDTCRVLFFPLEMLQPEELRKMKKWNEKWNGSTKLFDDVLKIDGAYKYRMAREWKLADVKAGIREAAGGEKGARVLWHEYGCPTLNARWMLEAMEAIRARLLYASGDGKEPAILYAGDDVRSSVKEYIWPCNNKDGRDGFFSAEEAGG